MKIRKNRDSYMFKPEDLDNEKAKSDVKLNCISSLPDDVVDSRSRKAQSQKKRVSFSPEVDRQEDRTGCFTGEDDDSSSLEYRSDMEPVAHNGLYPSRNAPRGDSVDEKSHRRTPSGWVMTGTVPSISNPLFDGSALGR